MDVDSLYAQNTGTIFRSVRPQVDNVDPARQNQQTASEVDIAEQTDPAVQEAFQVQISSQAQGRLAADAADSTQDAKIQEAVAYETQPVPQAGQGSGSGRIIDIVT